MCNEEILKHMEEDMTFRGLTAGTIHSYIMRVKRYMKFHEGKNIEELTEDDIRDFLKYLTTDTNNARRAINTYNSAIRFMYGTTLNKVLNLKRIPLFKIQKNKPEVFTKDELKRFFEACDDGFYYSLLYKAMFIRELVEAMKYKTECNDKTIEKQTKVYEAKINQLKNHINSFFPKEHLSEEQIKLKDKLIQNVIDNSETIATDLLNYVGGGRKANQDVIELSNLRKETVGRVISKEERERICYMQNTLYNSKNNIGKPEKIDTEFYKNSKIFDDLYSKTSHGYWQSTVEMFARSFACYVKDKLNNRSDYLCGHAEMDLGLCANDNGDIELIKAFPEGEERTAINEKMDKLIEILKEKALLHDYRIQEISNEFDYDYEEA